MILNIISPLLLSCWGFSFALRHGVSFFGGIQHSPVDGCSAASCNFGVLAGEDEPTSSYSTILELMDNCFTMCAIFCCTIQWTSYACAYVLCCAHSLSDVRLFATPWTVAHRSPLSLGILQARMLELPCPPPGDLPNLRIELRSPTVQADSLQFEPPGRPYH